MRIFACLMPKAVQAEFPVWDALPNQLHQDHPLAGTGRFWRFVLTSTEPRDEAADPMRRSRAGAGSPSILFDHSGGRFCTLWRAATVCQQSRLHHCRRNAVPIRWTSASRGRLREPGPTSCVSLGDRSPGSYTHSFSQKAKRMLFWCWDMLVYLWIGIAREQGSSEPV